MTISLMIAAAGSLLFALASRCRTIPNAAIWAVCFGLLIFPCRSSDAKINYRTTDPNFKSAFLAALDSLKNCTDCPHSSGGLRDTTLQQMVAYLESDSSPTFNIQRAPDYRDGMGRVYPADGCGVADKGGWYYPGTNNDVVLYWSDEPIVDDTLDDCGSGATNPIGAGNFTSAVILAHELTHCYFKARGQNLTTGTFPDEGEQFRAITFENELRRCKDVQPRVCVGGYYLPGYTVTWNTGSAWRQEEVVNNCVCSPSDLNGPSICPGNGGMCCHFDCKDSLNDNNNCGQCDNPCGGGSNQCCDGTCKDTGSSDVNNCGGCGIQCPRDGASQMPCVNGSCTCSTVCGTCSGYQCNGDCDWCPAPGTQHPLQCCWCGGDGCLSP